MRADPIYAARVEAAREELAELETVDWFGLHDAANERVCAAMAAYRAKVAQLEGAGIAAVRRSPINSSVTYAAPVQGLKAALDAALAERRQAEEQCQRIRSLRTLIENGGRQHAEFTSYEAPKLQPHEARARGGRAIVVDAKGRLVVTRSDRAPVESGPEAWAAERARRRAAGDARDAERQATRDRIRREKRGD